MARIFAYCRVSTADQTTDNQVQEIQAAGFAVEPKRVLTETISGSVPARERKGFARLLDKLEAEDVLIVTKLDRLGRNAMDVRATEYTVGANGPQARPGPLPPTSGYTYAVELSVDQALAAGARSVQFNKPVPVYIENVLDFPVGIDVPGLRVIGY